MRVCFTGTVVDADGRPRSRADLEAIARDRGLEPVASVTKRGCDLVVAADSSSSSGKARKARDFGIPVIDVAEFLRLAHAR
jgi:DNA polymerase-3 subunit epsilon